MDQTANIRSLLEELTNKLDECDKESYEDYWRTETLTPIVESLNEILNGQYDPCKYFAHILFAEAHTRFKHAKYYYEYLKQHSLYEQLISKDGYEKVKDQLLELPKIY